MKECTDCKTYDELATLIYKARPTEWIVITDPGTEAESEVATCKSSKLAEALCKGMGWDYTIKD